MKVGKVITLFSAALLSVACTAQQENTEEATEEMEFNVQKTEAEWREQLSDEQYRVLRQAGTEYPGTGEYNLHFEEGVYTCAGCGEELFDSDSKFNAHCGWPSFDKEIEDGKIIEREDRSHGMVRTEILCGNCGGHLGHVFDDGPTSTGLRYCVNSASLGFEAAEEKEEETESEE